MSTIRLTMAQALVRALAAQMTVIDGATVPIFAGVWAIFGHGNVAGLGEALFGVQDRLPTLRAHNEQAMAHAAVAFAKASRRRRFMAVTTSIGPGATNLVTAAAMAHVNRLPVLLLPGDVFATRRPDPVLQQIEDFSDGTISANDCLRPVSRYFDRLTRPEQLVPAVFRAMAVLTDPADCGPVTLALCQDVQAEAFDYSEHLFEHRVWAPRRPRPDDAELEAAITLLRGSQTPLVISGGGVLYSEAEAALCGFIETHGIPMAETQAGKSSVPDEHALNLGAIGVTGTAAANETAAEADVVLMIGTRSADFTTGSLLLFRAAKLIGLNVQPFDAGKHQSQPLVADAYVGLAAMSAGLVGWRAPGAWTSRAIAAKIAWREMADRYTVAGNTALPSDAQVLGAVQRRAGASCIVVCAAGGLPGELHKHWQAQQPLGYHVEYGFSTMGYEIAGGLGVKMAHPSRDVVVLVGDGSYLMMNSEIATSIMLRLKLTIIVLDNGGFGCISRLQRSTGGAPFNNLVREDRHADLPFIDFALHARSLGAVSEKVSGIAALEAALVRAADNETTTVIVIDTDATAVTDAGGHWWDVAVPEISLREPVREARVRYETALRGN